MTKRYVCLRSATIYSFRGIIHFAPVADVGPPMCNDIARVKTPRHGQDSCRELDSLQTPDSPFIDDVVGVERVS